MFSNLLSKYPTGFTPSQVYVFIPSDIGCLFFFFFSSRRRHTRCLSDWSSDVCSSDLLYGVGQGVPVGIDECSAALCEVAVHVRAEAREQGGVRVSDRGRRIVGYFDEDRKSVV